MLIKGTQLNPRQREQVLAAYIYRWTRDNPHRERSWQGFKPPVRPTIPLISDDEWLKQYAFNFVEDGSRLHARRKYAVPVYGCD